MKKKFYSIISITYITIILITFIIILINGLEYYKLSMEERFYSEFHKILKPSGLYGHAFGIFGSILMILGVIIYMIRKRMRRFSRIGILKHWLEFHIFLCVIGPLLILFHSSFKFGGIVSIAFWSMTAVVLSGFVGRFIYIKIPRSIQGKELDLDEMGNLNDEFNMLILSEKVIDSKLFNQIETHYPTKRDHDLGFFESFKLLFLSYFIHQKILNTLNKQLKNINGLDKHEIKRILKLVKSKLILSRNIFVLRSMQKAFSFWHVFHLPFAITMFVIMVVHIVVSYVFGYKWIF